MIWEGLFEYFRHSGLDRWAEQLESASLGWLVGHGDYGRWAEALAALPEIDAVQADYHAGAVTVNGRCDDPHGLRKALSGLMPWRKGPFQIADVYIDCEWRSNLKWDRVAPHFAP